MSRAVRQVEALLHVSWLKAVQLAMGSPNPDAVYVYVVLQYRAGPIHMTGA